MDTGCGNSAVSLYGRRVIASGEPLSRYIRPTTRFTQLPWAFPGACAVAHRLPFTHSCRLAKTTIGQRLEPAAQLNFPVQCFVFPLFFAQQERQERDAIGLFRRFSAGHVGKGRHQILKRANMLGRRPGRDASLPIRDEGHSNTAFVQIPLPAPECSVAVEKLVIVAPGPGFDVIGIVQMPLADEGRLVNRMPCAASSSSSGV